MASETSIVYAYVRSLVLNVSLVKPQVVVGYNPKSTKILLTYEEIEKGGKTKKTVAVTLDEALKGQFENFFGRFCTKSAKFFEVEIPRRVTKDGWSFFRFYV